MAYGPDLTKMLVVGARYTSEQVTYVIEAHSLDPAVLPTGQVVGCDPLVFADTQAPFTVTVQPGSYPLRAWVAVLYKDAAVEWQRRVAALQLVVRDESAVRWEPALTDGQDPAKLGEDEYFGYGVDAGTGTLADLVAVRALAGWDFEQIDDVFIPAQLPVTPVPGAICAITDAATAANVAR